MSWRYSTGLRNALLEDAARVPHAVADTTISFTNVGGAGAENQILDSNSGLTGFLEKAYITVLGSAGNDGTYKILSVAAGVIVVDTTALSIEAAGASVILATAEGGSYRGIFRNCTIKIFASPQGASADDADPSTVLCQITLASGVFVPGSPGNGLNFGQVGSAQLKKEVGEVWSGENGADGTAQSFRIYANAVDGGGSSTTAIRLDGACATSGAQMNLTNTTLVNGVTTTIDQVVLSLPAA